MSRDLTLEQQLYRVGMNFSYHVQKFKEKNYVFTTIIYNFLKNQIPQTEIKYELKTKFANLKKEKKKKAKPKTQ